MAKKVLTMIKLQVPAGAANPDYPRPSGREITGYGGPARAME